MLSLKLTLVVLILEIGERVLCAGSCATDAESSPVNLPPSSLINTTDDKKCRYQVLADLVNMGFLTVDCTKVCPTGEGSPVTNGESCILTVTWSPGSNDVTVSVGTCENGTCVTPGKSDCRTITLPGPYSGEEGEEEEEDEEEEEEEEVEKKKE
uniref:Putative secreted protein n=1 Tax=Ixodes ricinus TaxID=34613 RepID=A0A090X9H2_IXORI